MIKLSIIVPVYNVEKYLKKCIDSILSQEFKDFELIIVDDGSTDNSGKICDEYIDLDKRVKVIHKDNGGLSSARNSGLNIASGEYVGFVDSDDWISSLMYQVLVNIAVQYKADIIQCNYKKTSNENESIKNYENKLDILNKKEILNNLYNNRYVETIVTWNKIYRRSLFNEIKFPIGKLHEDEFTIYKLLYKSSKTIILNDIYYFYRETPNSIMNSSFNEKRLDYLEALDERLEFFKINNENELYHKTLEKYNFAIKKYYFICVESDKKDKILIKKIKNTYRKFIYLHNKDKVISITDLIFIVSPSMYSMLNKVRRKNYF